MSRNWNQWAIEPYSKKAKEHIEMTAKNTARAVQFLLTQDRKTLKRISKQSRDPNLLWVFARTILREGFEGKPQYTYKLMELVIGKAAQKIEIVEPKEVSGVISFEQFIYNSGYPAPYPKQLEMQAFALREGPRLLLGARNYGKTDYITILTTAYDVYLDYVQGFNPIDAVTYLIVTKSKSKNASIISEIARCLDCNGIPLEKQNSSCLRVSGLVGKAHSVEALTVGSTAFRGHHPKRIIMDDPITEDDDSEATRKRVQKKYNELSKLTRNILIIGQPVHKFDLYETLRPLLEKLELPYGSIPELDVDLKAQRLAGVSEESIQASYFLKVISEVGNPLENIRFIDSFPAGTSVAFIDPSFEGGDYTAISVVRQYFEGVAVFGKCWKRAWFNCIDDFQKVIDSCNVQRLCFETNSLGDQPVMLLRDALTGCGIVGKKSVGNKHARISSMGPFANNIHLARTSDRIYIDQTTKYEYGAKKDDAPDSLASCLGWIGLIKGV